MDFKILLIQLNFGLLFGFLFCTYGCVNASPYLWSSYLGEAGFQCNLVAQVHLVEDNLLLGELLHPPQTLRHGHAIALHRVHVVVDRDDVVALFREILI